MESKVHFKGTTSKDHSAGRQGKSRKISSEAREASQLKKMMMLSLSGLV